MINIVDFNSKICILFIKTFLLIIVSLIVIYD